MDNLSPPKDDEKTTVRSSWVWDVKIPSRKQSIIPRIPMVYTRLSKKLRRRITIEIHSKLNDLREKEFMTLELGDLENDLNNLTVESDITLPFHLADSEPIYRDNKGIVDNNPKIEEQDSDGNDSDEEVISGRSTSFMEDTGIDSVGMKKFPMPQEEGILDGEEVIIKIEKAAKSRKDKEIAKSLLGNGDQLSEEEGTDFQSVSTLGLHGVDEEPDESLWIELKRIPLGHISFPKLTRHVCLLGFSEASHEVSDNHGLNNSVSSDSINKNTCFEIHFKSIHEATNFYSVLVRLIHLNTEREHKNRLKMLEDSFSETMHLSIGEISNNPKEKHIQVLIEILACKRLQFPSLQQKEEKICKNSYFVVRNGNNEIHRTSLVKSAEDMIWTATEKSLLLLNTLPLDPVYMSHKVYFELHEVSSTSTGLDSNETILGVVEMKQEEFFTRSGERIEVCLKGSYSSGEINKNSTLGKLSLSFRHASEHDIAFMDHLSNFNFPKNPNKKRIENYFPFHRGTGYIAPNFNEEIHAPAIKGQSDSTKFRVKPRPDPKRKEETRFMEKREFIEEANKKSLVWVEGGTGTLGKFYVEVLKCEGLLIKSSSRNEGINANTFVSMVFEDSFASTEVIRDSSSPTWMPWTKRAFIFNTKYPLSKLYLSIHSFDEINTSNHIYLGKLVINPSNLSSCTEYTLDYEVKGNSKIAMFQKQIITLRVQFDRNNEREPFSTFMKSQPTTKLYIEECKDYNIMTKTTGISVSNDLNLDMLSSFAEDINSVEYGIHALVSSFGEILFWRKPLWSMLVLGIIVFMFEEPRYIPSMSAFFLACFFLIIPQQLGATNSGINVTQRYIVMIMKLIFGYAFPQTIDFSANAHVELKEDNTRNQDETSHLLQNFNTNGNSDDDEGISIGEEDSWAQPEDHNVITSTETDNLSLLNPNLVHLQSKLETYSGKIRYIRSILYWEDPYTPFWITTSLFFLSFLLFHVDVLVNFPKYSVVLTICGPWMWIVGKAYDHFRNKGEKFRSSKNDESESKLRDHNMMMLLYGHYSIDVPLTTQSEFVHFPMKSSHAHICGRKILGSNEITTAISSQKHKFPKRETCNLDDSLETTTLSPIRKKNINSQI